MIGLDTNILVRFFAKDDIEQSRRAEKIMASLTSEEPGWISLIALLELVWVATSRFHYDREELAEMLDQLLTRDEVIVQAHDCVYEALIGFRSGKADFADYVISASAREAGCIQTLTFDRAAAKAAGMTLAI